MIVKNSLTEVVLSFDDGPSDLLPEFLSVLREEKVQGVFFWQTDQIQGKVCPSVIDEGHVIGSHSHSHTMLNRLSYEEQFRDIAVSKEKLERLIGDPITWFRPPHGLYNEDTLKVCNQLKLKVVLWNITSWDWKHVVDNEKIIENVLTHVSPGDIILLHELQQTLNVLPVLIHGIREKGLHLAAPFTKLF